MKKQYMNPLMEMIIIKPCVLLAGSNPDVNVNKYGSVAPNAVESRFYGGFLEEEEEEEF